MFGYYTPLLFLQAFCVYHAYRNNAEQRWYWFIILFPGFGCFFYLYHHFYNRSTVTNLTETVKEVVNSNYKLEQLEKAHRFSDNTTNKLNLADAYIQYGRFSEAIVLYNECMRGFMADDPTLKMKLIQAYFLQGDHQGVINIGNELATEPVFKNAEARIAYAWSYFHLNNAEQANKVFEDMNKSFTNYKHRVAYCNFLKQSGKQDVLRDLLAALLEEFEHMRSTEHRVHRNLIAEVREMAREIDNAKK